MLKLDIPSREIWDPEKEEFIYTKSGHLQLEHSLVSLRKWESKWHKAFLGDQEKTEEELLDYVRCMTITQNVDSDIYGQLTNQDIDMINAYIEDPMTATFFSEVNSGKHGRKQVITAEIIYYWMISFNIPVEFQKWHLNQLLTLIRVCEIKNTPPKKRSKSDIAKSYAELNKIRRQKLNTKG